MLSNLMHIRQRFPKKFFNEINTTIATTINSI